MQAITGELLVGLIVSVGGIAVAFILKSICKQIEDLAGTLSAFEQTVNTSVDNLRKDIQAARAERESSAGRLHDRINDIERTVRDKVQHVAETYVDREALARELARYITHEFCNSQCPSKTQHRRHP